MSITTSLRLLDLLTCCSTTDGGNTFTNEDLVGGSNGLAAWLTIDVTSDGSAGVTGGLCNLQFRTSA